MKQRHFGLKNDWFPACVFACAGCKARNPPFCSAVAHMTIKRIIKRGCCSCSFSQIEAMKRTRAPTLEAALASHASAKKEPKVSKEKTAEEPAQSALAEILLEWVSWGVISFPMVQQAAAAAMQDGANACSGLAELAALGGPNALPRNMRRDCLRKLDISFVEPDMVKLPMMPAKGEKKVIWVEHPIFLPHVMFHHLYQEHRDFFMEQIRTAGPHVFWEQCPDDDPRLRGHPVLDMPGFEAKACPLILRGDGAQYTTHHDSIKSLQWSFLGSDSVGTRTWDHVFLIVVLVSRICCKMEEHDVDTWDIIFRMVVSSFNSLLIGRWPSSEDNPHELGDPIADGDYFGFLYVITADMEYACNVLCLEHFNAIDFCWLCKAQQNDGELNFRRVAEHAPWRDTLLSPDESFLEDGHCLWHASGINRYSFVGDWLHTVHLGIMAHLLGSAMDWLADELPGSRDARCAALWNKMVATHKRLGPFVRTMYILVFSYKKSFTKPSITFAFRFAHGTAQLGAQHVHEHP